MEVDKTKDGGIAQTQNAPNLQTSETNSDEALLPHNENEVEAKLKEPVQESGAVESSSTTADGASPGSLPVAGNSSTSIVTPSDETLLDGENFSNNVVTQTDLPLLKTKPEEHEGEVSPSSNAAQPDKPLLDVIQPEESVGQDSSSEVVAGSDKSLLHVTQPEESVGDNSSTTIAAQSEKSLLDEIQPQESVGEHSSNGVVAESNQSLLDEIQAQESVGENSSSSVTAESDKSLVDVIQPQESVVAESAKSLPDVLQRQESADENFSSSVETQSDQPSGNVILPHIEARMKVLTASYSNPEMQLKESSSPLGRDKANVQTSNTSRLHFGRTLAPAVIDTAAPIPSVKHAVSKFGGIVDWKAHRAHTMERRNSIRLELEKAHEEIPVFKRLCDAAENEKQQFLKKLNSSKRLNEELKLNLERAEKEEQQAKQDSELALLRMEELKEGIADEASKAAKAQLDVAKARHAEAVAELKTVQEELQQLQQDFTNLQAERESAVNLARESVAKSKEVEKCLEDLSIELINTKDSLETAQASHLEAEEQRAERTASLEKDMVIFEKELKETEAELERLYQELSPAQHAKAQLATSLEMLQKLKAEFGVYMDSDAKQQSPQETQENLENRNRGDMQAAVSSTRMALEETRANIKTSLDEVNRLKESTSSLETELSNIQLEIAQMQNKEKKEDDSLDKLLIELRGEECKKAKEEATQSNIEKSHVESRLVTVQKEIELAKACEKLASDAIKAQKEIESKVSVSLEEYYGLNMQAHEAEEDANKRVLAALSEIDAAKESELESKDKLNEVNTQIAQMKKELEIALQKLNLAKEAKLKVEEELRELRSKQHKGDEVKTLPEAEKGNGTQLNSAPEAKAEAEAEPEEKTTKKKKKFTFPRFFMFMGKKKSSTKPK